MNEHQHKTPKQELDAQEIDKLISTLAATTRALPLTLGGGKAMSVKKVPLSSKKP